MRLNLQVLSAEQIELVHESTLDLLGRRGLTMKAPKALETFRRHGLKTDGGQVFFSRDVVEKALATAPSAFTLTARDPAKTLTVGRGRPAALAPCAGVPMLLTEDGLQRPVGVDDFRDMLRLTQTSPTLDLACSGSLYPSWPRPTAGLYLQMLLTLAMTDRPLIGQSEGPEVSAGIIEMVRRALGHDDRPVVVGICNSLSPMAWDERMLEGLRVYAELGQPVNVSCCAMSGATSPVSLAGGVLQANCEVLGGLIYAQLLSPGLPIIYGTTSSIMDMGSMGLALGAPEYSLLSAGCGQMAARYDLPYRGGGGLTDAKVLDAQAGAESAWNLLLSLGAGASFMLQSVGVLESFMSASFDKWIFDEEIMAKFRRLERGLTPWPEDLAGVVAEGQQAGGFLKLKSTLKSFRSEFRRPVLGDRRSFESWTKDGGDLRRQAWTEVRRRLAAYEPPTLAPEALAELEALVERLTGAPPAQDLGPDWARDLRAGSGLRP
ncbi:MAG: trimethylamine methyltransferase family protein [Deltaproteobacteria bacterium]|jgi:trimethylamine--corrinoid protein Co-methyltransferase|nr:trimethylamine methyltransferase family protein [Deltaproteobacteria bacterium]